MNALTAFCSRTQMIGAIIDKTFPIARRMKVYFLSGCCRRAIGKSLIGRKRLRRGSAAGCEVLVATVVFRHFLRSARNIKRGACQNDMRRASWQRFSWVRCPMSVACNPESASSSGILYPLLCGWPRVMASSQSNMPSRTCSCGMDIRLLSAIICTRSLPHFGQHSP